MRRSWSDLRSTKTRSSNFLNLPGVASQGRETFPSMTRSHRNVTVAKGQCFCGMFRFAVSGSFGDVRYCHCSQCRRKTGTAFSANAKIRNDQWSFDGPTDLITEFEHKPGLYNAFCSRCGSPLYARSDHDPDDIRVRLGGFDGPIDVTITGHVRTSWKAEWYSIDDEIPQFHEAFIPER